ncbi:MAG: RecX family transcriptional regulator [Lachnospiraceae bacterium]|nr:RecX family transcriptional regulator [Lachnospiraceae bacterium]
MNELLPKRALNRSLKIITGHDMTEYMLSKKLKDDGYPDSIIENTVNVLKKERLINDERYIKGYIEAKSTKKSKRDILIALSQKGIDSKKAERIFEELCEEGTASDEKELIRKLLVKRHFDFDNADYGSKQKEIQYLLRKGFSFDSIEEAMNKPE